MKSNKIKLVVAAIAISTVAGLFVGCGNSSVNSTNNTASNTTTTLSGSITAAGSTALQPLAAKAAEDFKVKNPNVTINVQPGGSGAGLTQVSGGTVQIGNSDIFAEDKSADLAKGLVDHKVCAVGFAVITSKDVTVTNLTKAQIQDIFSGKITNWKDVGGADSAINLVHRTTGSGTRVTFDKVLLQGKEENDKIGTTQDSNGQVLTSVSQTKGSISYIALPYLLTNADAAKNITSLKLEGVAATNDNIKAGKYIFWSYEHMYTKGTETGLTKAFIDYVSGSEDRDLIIQLGYIPSSDVKSK